MGLYHTTIDNRSRFLAIDTETTGVDEKSLPFQISLCDEFGNQLLIEWEVDPTNRRPIVKKKDIRLVQKLCTGKILIFHNRLFDIEMLERVGCYLDWKNGKSRDTQIYSHVFNSDVHTLYRGRLKELSLHYLDEWDDDQDSIRKAVSAARKVVKKLQEEGNLLNWKLAIKKTSSKKDNDHLYQDYWLPRAVALYLKYEKDHPWYTLCATYANCDTERTMLLFLLFSMRMDRWKQNDPRRAILERENKLSPHLLEMKQKGLSVFPQRIESEIERFESKINPAIKKMQKLVNPDFNIESPKQLQVHLFETLKFPIMKKTKTGGASTDAKVRESLRTYHESADYKKSSSKLKKQRGQFIDAWDSYKESISCRDFLKQYRDQAVGDQIHTQLVQCGAATTRFSCRNHNIKKADKEKGIEGLRHVYGPHSGRTWFCIDYSQLQLRIFAYLTNEQSMIDAFAAGYDFHGFMASRIFNKNIDKITKSERRIAKNVNFGFVFGASPKKIEATSGMTGLWDTVCSLFPSAHHFMQVTKAQVRSKGYVTTPHGYRLYTDYPHKGVNYIVQGCEGDIVKEAMNLCGDYLQQERDRKQYSGHMKFQIHDELIFDLPKKTPKRNRRVINKIVKLMEQPGKDIGMVLPVDVEVTNTDWSNVKSYELAT